MRLKKCGCEDCRVVPQVKTKKEYKTRRVYPFPRVNRWTEENYERWRERQRRAYNSARGKEKGTKGFYTIDDIIVIRERQMDQCVYCRNKLKNRGHLDHKIPLSKGGSNWPDNLQLLCGSCNRKKSARTHEEYILIIQNTK